MRSISTVLAVLSLGILHAADRPNIVFIFIDDMGYADISPFGNTELRTPNLERLAQQGRKFTSYYATPVCSMSRASLMTGCYNTRVSVPGVFQPNSKLGLNPDETILPEVLKPKGYATACIGKWHLGDHPAFLPNKQGFDFYFGLPYSNNMLGGKKWPGGVMPPLPLYRNGEVIETQPDQSQLTKRYTEEAVRFIREKKDGPFFIYLPHSMIHEPVAASAGFKGKSKMGLVGDSIEEIDWSVGQIMKTLEELKLEENTLVIFTSDNGPDRRPAPPFRGNKTTCFEGGVREPCIMRWPGKIPAGTSCDQILGNIDMLPTFAGIVGQPLDVDRTIDGKDVTSLMFDAAPGVVRDTHLYFNVAGKLGAIRQGDWKLFVGMNGGKSGNRESPGALYNLKSDCGESKDVAAANPEIVSRLREEARKRVAEITAHRRPIGEIMNAKP